MVTEKYPYHSFSVTLLLSLPYGNQPLGVRWSGGHVPKGPGKEPPGPLPPASDRSPPTASGPVTRARGPPRDPGEERFRPRGGERGRGADGASPAPALS